MSDEIQDDTHDKLIKEFINYSNANAKFDAQGYMAQARIARHALVEIGKLVKTRRKEIFDRRVALHGYAKNKIKPTAPSAWRQRKINKQNQNQQDKNIDDTN